MFKELIDYMLNNVNEFKISKDNYNHRVTYIKNYQITELAQNEIAITNNTDLYIKVNNIKDLLLIIEGIY